MFTLQLHNIMHSYVATVPRISSKANIFRISVVTMNRKGIIPVDIPTCNLPAPVVSIARSWFQIVLWIGSCEHNCK